MRCLSRPLGFLNDVRSIMSAHFMTNKGGDKTGTVDRDILSGCSQIDCHLGEAKLHAKIAMSPSPRV